MLRSAWVNIKKAEGIAYSENGDLRSVATRDAHFFKKQISLLAPRFVICGKVYDTVKEVIFPEAQKIEKTEFSYFSANGVIVVDYYHPGRKARESYSSLAKEASRIVAALSLNFSAEKEDKHDGVACP